MSQAIWLVDAGKTTKNGQGFLEVTDAVNSYTHYIHQDFQATLAQDYIWEAEIAPVGGRNVQIGDDSVAYVQFNLSTCAKSGSAGSGIVSWASSDAGGGYCKISMRRTCGVGSIRFMIGALDGGNAVYKGDGTKGLNVRKMSFRPAAATDAYVQTVATSIFPGLNGLPVVYFNGSSNTLSGTIALSSLISAGEYSTFVVGRPATAGIKYFYQAFSGYHGMGLTNSSSPFRLALENNDGNLDVDYSGTVTAGRAAIFEGRHVGGNIYTYLNGTASVGTASGNTNTSTSAFRVGSAAGGGYKLDGDIAEILIFNRALSAADRAIVYSYLKSKWGVG